MTYSGTGDLLLEDVVVGPEVRQKFVALATDEINSKLGVIYKLPLRKIGTLDGDATADSWLELPEYQQLLIKICSNKLASGRCLLSLDLSGEQTTLHAYGKSLVDEAKEELLCMANGDVDLDAVRVGEHVIDPARKRPSIKQEDSESLLLGFENTVMRGGPLSLPWYSRPGQKP